MSILASIAAWLGLIYLAIAVLLFIFQRKLLYRPDARRVAPAEIGLQHVTEVEFQTSDGETLICWHAKPAPGQPTLLYFHGNGGGLTHRKERFLRFAASGIGLFMASYRGYSGSSGSPSEMAVIADAIEIYDWLERQAAGPIVLYGESLGTGVAVQVAAQRRPAALILEAPYTSIADVAQGHYRLLPVRPFLRDRYDSMEHIAKITSPLLVLHGERDKVVPFELGRKLYEAAPQPKRMAAYPMAGHCDVHLLGGWDAMRSFLAPLHQS